VLGRPFGLARIVQSALPAVLFVAVLPVGSFLSIPQPINRSVFSRCRISPRSRFATLPLSMESRKRSAHTTEEQPVKGKRGKVVNLATDDNSAESENASPEKGLAPISKTADNSAKGGSSAKSKNASPEEKKPSRAGKNCWLIKSEPDEYSLQTLQDSPNGQDFYDGIRNYVARNNLREMQVGDLCFFYHSSCKKPAIVGICEVAEEATVDPKALDPKDKYYDPKSDPAKPRWFRVQVKYQRALRREITLEELKQHKEGTLSGLDLLRSPRLSTQRVSHAHWEFILSLEGKG
jgi:predicted RNA-binding protein with PUA-like domain